MRRFTFIAFLLLFAAIAGITLIQNSQVDTDVTAKATKVGVLLTGSRSDRSYCQAHYEALEAIKDELNLHIVYLENVPDSCYRYIESLVRDEGCKIIVGVSIFYGDDMRRVATEHPDVYFFNTGGVISQKNFSSYFGRMYQARYLSGVVAGMKTKTGELGYVAAFSIPECIRGINAFTLGVRSVRPDAVVHVRYCGSWVEDAPAKEASRALLDGYPIDVLALHTNSLEPHREADARGIWSIGYNLDNAAMFPNTYLTACVWRWEVYYRKQIRNCLQGKFHGSNDLIDMEDGIVGIPESAHIDPQTKAKLQAARTRLKSRGFDVFYGPIRDNTGLLRVEAWEAMPDDEMFNNFDWYVEGVTIEG